MKQILTNLKVGTDNSTIIAGRLQYLILYHGWNHQPEDKELKDLNKRNELDLTEIQSTLPNNRTHSSQGHIGHSPGQTIC